MYAEMLTGAVRVTTAVQAAWYARVLTSTGSCTALQGSSKYQRAVSIARSLNFILF